MRRRTLLGGLGAAATAALFRPFTARAETAALPQRLLMIHRPCGTIPEAWWPTGSAQDWMLSPILQSFEPLHNRMVVLKGIACPRDPGWNGAQSLSGMLAMTTPPPASGWPALPGPPPLPDTNTSDITAADQSIDQLLLGNVTGLRGAPLPSLQLAASLDSAALAPAVPTSRVVSYASAPSAPFSTPRRPVLPSDAWQQLSPNSGGTPVAQAHADNAVWDFLTADVNQLRPRLPVSEVRKVDNYLSQLQSLEAGAPQCPTPVLGPLPVAQGFGQDEAQYTAVLAQQASIIKTAFQCDLTRVISMTYASALSTLDFSKIIPGVPSAGYYDLAQTFTPSAKTALQAIETFYAQQTAQLLIDLESIPEGAGSVLDNTLVVYWSNDGVASNHSTADMPVLLFGGKFLNLQGGSYLQFQNRFMSDLWVETAHAFGYTALTQYGAARWNQGPLPGIYG